MFTYSDRQVMGTEQFLAADRDRFPLKVRGSKRLSDRMSRGAGHLCVGRSSESVGIEASDTSARCANVSEAKPSERSVSGEKRT